MHYTDERPKHSLLPVHIYIQYTVGGYPVIKADNGVESVAIGTFNGRGQLKLQPDKRRLKALGFSVVEDRIETY